MINFFDWTREKAESYRDLFEIVEQRVKPERDKVSIDNSTGRRRHDLWWLYGSDAKSLYHSIGRGAFFDKHPKGWVETDKPERVLVVTGVSKTLAFAFVPNKAVFTHALFVFSDTTFTHFAILQSAIHGVYAWRHASKMKTDLRYTPATVYETFPFPLLAVSEGEKLGEALDSIRRLIMSRDNIGLTRLYNCYHDQTVSDSLIVEMRYLQVQIDNAVRDAYGWTDLDLEHGFHEVGYLPANDNVRFTISESARIEVLKRLAKLNKERWEEEEAAGLHKKGKR